MKDRVLHALRKLSLLPDANDEKISQSLLPQLMKETALTEREISDRAARVLKIILHHYADFAIGTMDSFSHRIIRSFAHDFGLPVQFNVELDSEELLIKAVDLLLDRVGQDKELTTFLGKFLETRIDEDSDWNIDRILVTFAGALLDEEGQTKIRELRMLSLEDFTRIAGDLFKKIKVFEAAISRLGGEAFHLLQKSGLGAERFYQGNKGIYKYFENLCSGRVDKIQPNAYVLKTIAEDKWESAKATPIEKSQIESLKPKLIGFFDEITRYTGQYHQSYELNKLLTKTIFPLAVLNEIDKTLTAFKKQHNLIHISEFNRRIASIVMHEPVPFIYERIGERYHHIMIDEFQDTSRLQWHNFIPLIENALAGGHFNLVVGDGKQAIYRWRNGDVSQFTQLPALEGSAQNPIIRQRQQVLVNHYAEKSLVRNFRSCHEIVAFNNRFFHFLAGFLDESGQAVYKGMEQQADNGKTGGLINIRFFPKISQDVSFESWNIKKILEIIEDASKDGFSRCDIAILCRKNSQASTLARALIEAGIEVISSESLLLSQSPEVNFLISLMTFLSDPDDLINQAGLATYLLQTGRLKGISLHQVLHQITSDKRKGEGLIKLMQDHGWIFLKDELLALPLYDLSESLIRIFALNATVNPYLQFFLDAILAFSNNDRQSNMDFLKWWEKKKNSLSLVVPEGIDAIRIMTIHKSKGLQFPMVIFPFATERKRLTRDYLWVDLSDQHLGGFRTAMLKTESALGRTVFKAQYEEEEKKSLLDLVNLLYVVMTRPEERLYILTSDQSQESGDIRSLPGFFSEFLRAEGEGFEGKLEYQSGQRGPRKKRSVEETGDPLLLNSFLSRDWRKKIRIRNRAPKIWNMDNPMEKINFGNQVHAVLSAINTREDVEPAIRDAVSKALILPEEVKKIKAMILSLIDHPELGVLYSDQVMVKTEPEILVPDGSVFRPDRVVFLKGQMIIVEYKTGQKDDKHILQLAQYEKLMISMGYESVKKYLVYLHEEPEVIMVS